MILFYINIKYAIITLNNQLYQSENINNTNI